jgi:hypothetical protein
MLAGGAGERGNARAKGKRLGRPRVRPMCRDFRRAFFVRNPVHPHENSPLRPAMRAHLAGMKPMPQPCHKFRKMRPTPAFNAHCAVQSRDSIL